LAAAYALVGNREVAQEIGRSANVNFTPRDHDYRTYGSVFRNRAMALETLVALGDSQQRELAISLAKDLSSQNWYSTQETAFALLALAKMAIANGGTALALSYTHNGKETTVRTERAMAQRDLAITAARQEIQIRNGQANTVYVTLAQRGKLPVGQELELQRNLQIGVAYRDVQGRFLDVSQLRQGSEFQVDLTLYNPTHDAVENVALTHIVPSGWEILDTSFAGGNGPNAAQADHVDIRDDRTQLYFNLDARQSKTFTIPLNASYLGEYYLPGPQVEAMYDNAYQARGKGQWIKVIQ